VDVDVDDTSVVSGVSNPEEFDVDVGKENEVSASPSDLLSPLVLTKISLPKQKPKKSWVWHHFKPIMTSREYAYCMLCSTEIFYGSSRSTGMKEHHIQRKHPKVHTNMLNA
jgi:hypothetical protein